MRNGKSTTEIDATLATLASIEQSPHAINPPKSADDIVTDVACGDIAAAGTSTAPATTTAPLAPIQTATLAMPCVRAR